MKKRYLLVGAVFLVIALVIGMGLKNDEPIEKKDFIVYTTPTCGCCMVYSDYLEKWFKVGVIKLNDLNEKKEEFGVPSSMNSCHTGYVKGYVVEGHIPIEAIDKLLEEKPDIKGIAMPAMPQGSPGMPGKKTAPFVIYQINNDGSLTEFLRM